MFRRSLLAGCAAAGTLLIDVCGAAAQNPVKIGVVVPMTGPSAAVGREVVAGAKLYIQQHGGTIAGQKIELIIRDDAGVPDNGKRLAQELIVNDKVNFLGAGATPTAMAMAPLATEAKVATVVMVSGTSVLTERSPYFVRTSFTIGQQSGIIADWAVQNGSKKAVVLVNDRTPGTEASKVFEQHFIQGGGKVLDTLRVPLANPDFSPFLQRARDLQPDTMFVFVPAGQAGTLARQFAERGLNNSGINLIGTGDIVDDDDLAGTGDTFLGVVTAGFYSAAHSSEINKTYVDAYARATGHRANFISVGGYDAVHLIFQALEKTGGKTTDADALIGAMKGMKLEVRVGRSRSTRARATSCKTSISAKSRR
jgi:branched-chain amino acid transport system substrate-binding protein